MEAEISPNDADALGRLVDKHLHKTVKTQNSEDKETNGTSVTGRQDYDSAQGPSNLWSDRCKIDGLCTCGLISACWFQEIFI